MLSPIRNEKPADLRWTVLEVGGGWIGAVMGRSGLRYVSLPRADRESAGREVNQACPGAAEDEAPFGRLRDDLVAYFSGQPVDLASHPVDAELTPFQQTVLAACARIPYGITKTYGELADEVGRPGAARAVGRVMASNPVPLVFP